MRRSRRDLAASGNTARTGGTSVANFSSNDALVDTKPLPLATIAPLLDYDNPEQLGPSLQKIISSGKEKTCLRQLRGIIDEKEAEIEKICHGNYQEFVKSVDQLIQIRIESSSLGSKIAELQNSYDNSSGNLLRKKEEIIGLRSTLQNVDEGIETLRSCLEVLELATRLNTYMDQRKYFVALKTVKELRTNHMQTITEFEFSKELSESLPKVQDEIKDAIKKDMADWYLTVRESQTKIGTIVLKHVSQKQASKSPSRPWEDDDSNQQLMEILEDQTLLDLSPIYQGSHVFDVLGELSDFAADYSENRRLQGNLLMSRSIDLKKAAREELEPNSLALKQLEGFKTFLAEVVGFFTVESSVVNRTENFRSATAVDALWDAAAQKISDTVDEAVSNCYKPQVILKLKEALLGFVMSMEALDYNTTLLRAFMTSMFEKYCDVAKTICGRRLSAALEERESNVITLNNKKDVEELCSRLQWDWSRLPGAAIHDFPNTLPFSEIVPVVSVNIREFIEGYCEFVNTGLSRQAAEIQDILKQSVDSILTHKIAGYMTSTIDNMTTFSHIMRTLHNFEYLDEVTHDLEEFLAGKRKETVPLTPTSPSSPSAANIVVTLQSSKSFVAGKRQCEARVFEMLKHKLEGFIDLAVYDWNPSTKSKSPSGYLRDMLTYMDNTFKTTFAGLSKRLISDLRYQALDFVTSQLYRILANPNVRKFNYNFVQNFDLDVTFLESYFSRVNDPNLEDAILELRQATDLVLSDDPSEYTKAEYRLKLYPRLNGKDAVIICSKLYATMPTILGSATERQRKRGLEMVIKGTKS